MDELTRIPVGGERPYDVLVGRELAGALPALVDGAEQVAVIHPPAVKQRAYLVAGELAARGVRPLPIEVPDAEAAKSVEVAGSSGWSGRFIQRTTKRVGSTASSTRIA